MIQQNELIPTSRQRLLSSLLSASFLVVLLAILFVATKFAEISEPLLEVRQIGVALPPPPPPPSQQTIQQQQDVSLQITNEGTGAILPDINIPKTIDISQPEMPDITIDDVNFVEFTFNREIFDLNQLDNLPALLTRVRITMPASLKKRGIRSARVRLDVVIGVTGNVTLNRIVENPYSELNKEIDKLIRRSKFSIPHKEGVAVSARFIWPIEISV